MPPSPSKNKRRRAEQAGRWAETLAEAYLRAQFYSIIDRRVRLAGGELDLVATRGALTLFVEVKMRQSSADFETSMAAVNQPRIIRAAQQYVSQNPHLAQTAIRFDVIFLAPWRWPRHLKGAFETSV